MDDIWKEMQQTDNDFRKEYDRRKQQVKTTDSVVDMERKHEHLISKLNKSAKDHRKSRTKNVTKRASTLDDFPWMRTTTTTVSKSTIANENKKATTKSSQNQSKEQFSDAKPVFNSGMILPILRKDINLIDAEEPIKRRRAMQRIESLLFQEDGTPTIDDNLKLKEVFEESMKPLLKRLADPSEKCRECATTLLSHFLRNVTDIGPVLPYFFPAIMERSSNSFDIDFEHNVVVGNREEHMAKLRGKAIPDHSIITEHRHNVAEPSEEMRLKLCQLLWTVVNSLTSRMLHSMIGPYFHDTVLFLHASARDPFPDLKVFALGCLEKVAQDDRFAHVFHNYCTALVKSLMPALRHRHSKVRIAAVRAIQQLVSCPYQDKCRGGGSEAIADLVGYREENVIPITAFYSGDTRINFFSGLVTDSNPAVRKQFIQMLQSWMTTLLDRWDHAARLLPYLLTGIVDQSTEVVEIALDTLDTLGKQYEEEHHDEIIDKIQYGVDGEKKLLNYDDPLPYPWCTRPRPLNHSRNSATTHRPRLGVRLYVRNYCGRFLKPVLSELGDWRANTKGHAVKLMKVCLVYQEENITMDFNHLLNALVSLISDPDIGDEIQECCELTGRYVLPNTYLDFLLPCIVGEEGTFQSHESLASKQASALRVLAALARYAKPRAIMPYYRQISRTLSRPSLLRDSIKSNTVLLPHFRACTTLLHVARSFTEQSNASTDLQYTDTGRLTSKGTGASHAEMYRTILLLQGVGKGALGEAGDDQTVASALDDLSCLWDSHRTIQEAQSRVVQLHDVLILESLEWLVEGTDKFEPKLSWDLLLAMYASGGFETVHQHIEKILELFGDFLENYSQVPEVALALCSQLKFVTVILKHNVHQGSTSPFLEQILQYLLSPYWTCQSAENVLGMWKYTISKFLEIFQDEQGQFDFGWVRNDQLQKLQLELIKVCNLELEDDTDSFWGSVLKQISQDKNPKSIY